MSQLAWNGFKLLAKRSVLWEEIKSADSDQFSSSSVMEKQVSKLLSHHLTQAVKCHHKSISLEAVQEALLLLKDLSNSNLGQGILCQSSCIANLLELLSDQELSPQVTHTVIVLLQKALPAVSTSTLLDIKLNKSINQQEEEQVKLY